jgi:hypothetical protein
LRQKDSKYSEQAGAPLNDRWRLLKTVREIHSLLPKSVAIWASEKFINWGSVDGQADRRRLRRTDISDPQQGAAVLTARPTAFKLRGR